MKNKTQVQSSVGYSGTSLPKKLGVKSGSRFLLIGSPKGYLRLLKPLPKDVLFMSRPTSVVNIAQVFVTRTEELQKHLSNLRNRLQSDTMIWVSWPKKAAKVATNVTENSIRKVALPLGFVDIKVCAVNEVWSALKLVVRKEFQ